MCGICGVVRLDAGPVSIDELRPVCDALRLRGPDDEGYWSGGGVALGHRRLSVIDPAGGHQPLGNEDGSVQVVCNAEIYDFGELRTRLEALGHVFRTRTDTEVLVHGWEAWGEDLVHQLNGMFAFAIWDQRTRTLVLARDRFGKKPLYWCLSGGRFLFASTLTALLRHPATPRRLDRLGLARYLAFEHVPAPGTILAGVQKLEAGCTLRLTADGKVRHSRYFQPSSGLGTGPTDRLVVAEELRQRLLAATKRRLVADVPVGFFLSGGIDSSSVLAAAVHAGATRLRTFTIGFDDPSFDESAAARAVAEAFGAEHHVAHLTEKELLDVVPTLGSILDEPLADASIVPTYLLSRLTRQWVTVALSGDGGDELFGGYPTHLAHRVVQVLGMLPPGLRGSLLTAARGLARTLPVSARNMSFEFKLKKLLEGLESPAETRHAVWLGAFHPEELGPLLGSDVDLAAVYEPVAQVYRQATGSVSDRVLTQDLVFYLGHQVLTKVDRASMACGLEVRSPLLDRELAEYACGLPFSLKVRGLESKAILREAMKPWLPRATLHRAKKGFGMPVSSWLRGPLRDLSRTLLLGSNGLSASGLVDAERTRILLEEHDRGEHDHRKRIWTLLVLELWRREHGIAAA